MREIVVRTQNEIFNIKGLKNVWAHPLSMRPGYGLFYSDAEYKQCPLYYGSPNQKQELLALGEKS